MISELSRKASNKYWAGLRMPPLLVSIDKVLSNRGMSFLEHDDDAPCSRWIMTLFPGYSLAFDVWPREEKAGKQLASVEFSISVESTRQWIVYAELEEICAAGTRGGVKSGIQSSAPMSVGIMSLSFNWLISAWSAGSVSFSSAFSLWEKIDVIDCEESIKKLEYYLDTHLSRLLKMLDTPSGLAETLVNIKSFPGATQITGPTSSDPIEFAMVIFRDLGDRRRANELYEQVLRARSYERSGSSSSSSRQDIQISNQLALYEIWLRG